MDGPSPFDGRVTFRTLTFRQLDEGREPLVVNPVGLQKWYLEVQNCPIQELSDFDLGVAIRQQVHAEHVLAEILWRAQGATASHLIALLEPLGAAIRQGYVPAKYPQEHGQLIAVLQRVAMGDVPGFMDLDEFDREILKGRVQGTLSSLRPAIDI